MNYPIQSLVYIAPILFIVMMVAFPLIGVFGGWKRAAYWGGGNFLFYIIGMLIWTFAGVAIAGPLVGFIKGIIGQEIEGDFSQITASILAPIWFVGFLILANIILVINYYAWFKRVAGLSKYKTIKKKGKNGEIIKTKVLVNHNYSTGYKAMSMVVGGVGMGALMLPTTFAMTNALYFTTTSYKTRINSSFAESIYKATAGTDSAIDWFSYYSGSTDSAADYDALFAALDMQTEKIEFTPPQVGDNPPPTENESLIDALTDTFDYGLGGINGNTLKYDEESEEQDREDIIFAVNEITRCWNELMDKAGLAMYALFNSNNAAQIVSDMVVKLAQSELEVDDSLTIKKDNIKNFLGDPDIEGDKGIFYTLLDEYKKDPIGGEGSVFAEIQQVKVSQKAYDSMVDAITNLYKWEETDDFKKEDYIGDFRDCMYQLLGLMFCY